MCGIAGIVNFTNKEVDPQKINKMLKNIQHRGPDDEGIFVKDNIGLGHVRLSIIDLSSAGHQPMFSADERYCLIFNGEIYNYLELKNELKDKYTFTTKTDTEVLLAAYVAWGENCLNKFNGDFAFVIYDLQEKIVFGARDRFGIKPFYYFKNDDAFIFASEIKAILPTLENVQANDKSIFEYLVFNRTDQSEETFFNDIFKLKHGHCFTIQNNKLNIKNWYDLKSTLHYPTVITPVEYREELNKSLRLRMRSDVPIGVSFSGGLDSSAITSILFDDQNNKDIKTFSAVYEKGDRADESKYINSYQNKLRGMHYTYPTSETFFEEFDDFISLHTEPIPSANPYAQYKVMQLAQGKVAVTIDGQGADEMLCGYDYFYGCYFKELLKSYQFMTLLKESTTYFYKNKSREPYAHFLFYLLPVKLKNYIGRKTFGSVSKEFYFNNRQESTISSDLYDPDTLHEFALQHFEYKLEHLLKWDDHNSMNFSIESRIPFLDHNVVEKTLSLPPSLLLKNGVSKYILRESIKDIIPMEIYHRYNKKGFETPADKWFREKPFQNYILEMLNSDSFKNRGYFDVNDCKQKYQKHLEGKINIAKDIWKWINLEVWFHKFIDKPKGKEIPLLITPIDLTNKESTGYRIASFKGSSI